MKVEIKERRLPTGNRSLYLEYYETGFRKKEYLGIFLVPDDSARARRLNGEALRKAQEIKAKRILCPPDFLVSNLLLPIGSLVYLLFCVSKWGWGFDKYVAEANKGKGLKFAKWLKPYFQFILPALIVVIFLQGLL